VKITLNLIFGCLIIFNSFGQEMKIYGHRGCRGLLPENTLSSFNKAIELGVDGIEWDVVVNKENKLYISHEPYIDTSYCQLINGEKIKNKSKSSLNIYKMNKEEIEKYDCGSIYQKKFPKQKLYEAQKPTVKEAFAELKEKNPIILFEIKSSLEDYGKYQPYPEEYCNIIKKEVENYKYLDNIIFMSFDDQIINKLHDIMPSQRLVYLIYKPQLDTKSYLKKLDFKPFALGMYYPLISRKTIKRLHNKKINVFAWTVNDLKKGNELEKIGLDGLITDYPNYFTKD